MKLILRGVMAFMIRPLLDFGIYIGVCYCTRRNHYRVAKLISKYLLRLNYNYLVNHIDILKQECDFFYANNSLIFRAQIQFI